MRCKPVSVLALVFAVLGALLLLLGLLLPAWFVLVRGRGSGAEIHHWHGLWHQRLCSAGACGEMSAYTRIEGGKEFFFISKVFDSLAVVLVMVGLILHVIYAALRQPLVRQAAIYPLCGAGLFALIASLIFVGKYGAMAEYKGQRVDSGECFPLSLSGAVVCLVASALTAWASYKKANFDDDDDDCKEITHEMAPGDMDKI